ncbi:uncharacterized protein ACB058_007471 isoform 1-T1 [Synchiropus picturatus]
MDEYLRTVQRRVGANEFEDGVHAVLGGPGADADTVAATLCLALHLSQGAPANRLFLPVLSCQQGVLAEETVRFLRRVNIHESLLLWRADVDLIKLHSVGKLSLTLLSDGLLDSSEYHSLESSIVRVVHNNRQLDAAHDGAPSALAVVAKEILQDPPECIAAALRETLGVALQLQSEAQMKRRGHPSAKLENLMRSLKRCSEVPTRMSEEDNVQDLERLLSSDLKEFSDRGVTLALASVAADEEYLIDSVAQMKHFIDRRGYDGLLVLLTSSGPADPSHQQVAVYSYNSDFLNQLCRELEKSMNWSLSRGVGPGECLQMYHLAEDTALLCSTSLEEELQSLIKEFISRHSSVLPCHPSSRTSSTEGVAGSVEFSQGSSGINDMDGSDLERIEENGRHVAPTARVLADGEEEIRGAGTGTSGELVSPDSGRTTIRSSRSSKESSIFLSDESPIGEVTGGGSMGGAGGPFLRNPSPLGLSSLSPPVPPERRRHRSGKNRSEINDLFSFDPLHSLPANRECAKADGTLDKSDSLAGSSSLSEYEELSIVDFSGTNSLSGNDIRTFSAGYHEQGNEMDTLVPQTPANSLVGSCPSTGYYGRVFAEDVAERISNFQHKDSVSSSLSETWEELGFDIPGALTPHDSNAPARVRGESPQNLLEKISDSSEREAKLREGVNQRGTGLVPQLSLITEQSESNWNTDSMLKDHWGPATLSDLQLTPPEEEVDEKLPRIKNKPLPPKRKAMPNSLTPDTSKEEDDLSHRDKESRKMELLDFWTYSAQKGFIKSDSGTTTSYPESLDMWNMTIRDDSLSPLTTPDNLSEASGSFCAGTPVVAGGASIESPGYSYGVMEMWNTTIQEDSSSTPSPEAAENGKNAQTELSGSSGVNQMHANKQVREEMLCDHNVKIVINAPEGRESEDTFNSSRDAQNHAEYERVSDLSGDMSDFPGPSMVTSTSEYDNVGIGCLSRASSPSPVADMIQLEDQSSPFLAVNIPLKVREDHEQYQETDCPTQVEYRDDTLDRDQRASQMFPRLGELRDMDWREEGLVNRNHDGGEQHQMLDPPPLIEVYSSVTKTARGEDQTRPHIGAQIKIKIEHESVSGSSRTTCRSQEHLDRDSVGNLEIRVPGTMSQSSSSEGDKDTLKQSLDSLHPGSHDELRSNSDGDSSSTLEMDYIIVSGTVTEADREWSHGPKAVERHLKGTRKPMETFSMLSCAATVLKSHAQAAHREQNQADQRSTVGDESRSIGSDETMSHSHSKDTVASPVTIEDGSCDEKLSGVTRSASPSLRYSSDHFLKTREEVYVHSRISMEDSDEGGQSPSLSPSCPASLENLRDWEKQMPQLSSELQSPVLSNSSASPNSSLLGSPLSDTGLTSEKSLALPFSGDLMEEEEDGDEQEEESHPNRFEGGKQHFQSDDLLSFTEELVQLHRGQWQDQQAEATDMSSIDCEKWSFEHLTRRCAPESTLRYEEETEAHSLQSANDSPAYQWEECPNVPPGHTHHGYNYHHIDQRTEMQTVCMDAKCGGLQEPTDVYAEFNTDAASQQYDSAGAEGYYDHDKAQSSFHGGQHPTFLHGGEPNAVSASELQSSQFYSGEHILEDSLHDQFNVGHLIDIPTENEDHARYVPGGYVHFIHSRTEGDSTDGEMRMASYHDVEDVENKEEPLSSAEQSAGSSQRKKLAAPKLNVSLDHSDGSLLSEDALDTEDEGLDTGDDLDVNIDELDSSDDNSLDLNRTGYSQEGSGDGGASEEAAAGHRPTESSKDGRMWRSVVIGEQEHRIDMACIEPYKRVISHGGYYAEHNAIIVFAACFLPDSDCDNYNYVMEQLFLYVISTLELMVAEDYMIVYLNGATPRRRMPGFSWMKRCYQMIDRRLKKNLKLFFIVHPSWFIRTLLGLTRPFISSKFSSKIKYVNSLRELGEIIPMEYIHIPASIVRYDKENALHKFACMRLDTELQDTAAK